MTEETVGLKRPRSSEAALDGSNKHQVIEKTHGGVTVIDPEGDIKMVLDSGTLLVSRKVLTLSSPVFLAMLGKDSKFFKATDKTLDQDGTRIIQFPEDNFEIMTVVANIIHLQFDKVPNDISFQQLYEIAILCGKYDLKRCLNHYPEVWSKPYLDKYPDPKYGDWLFISVVFGYDGLFKAMTQLLIMNTAIDDNGVLVIANRHHISEHVSPAITDQIAKSRAEAMFLVLDLYWQEKIKLLASEKTRVCQVGGAKQSNCDAINLGLLLQKLPELSDPRDPKPCPKSVISMIHVPRSIGDLCKALIFKMGDHRSCAVGAKLAAEANKLLSAVQGLELSTFVAC